MTPQTPYTPQNIKTEEIQDRIFEALDENGNLTDKEWRRLSLLADAGIYSMVMKLMPLIQRVETLEKSSIVLWAKNNKKLAWSCFWGLVIFASFVHEIIPWVSKIITGAVGLIP